MKGVLTRVLLAIPIAVCVFVFAVSMQDFAAQPDFLEGFLWAVSPHQSPRLDLITDLIRQMFSVFAFLLCYMTFLYRDFMTTAIYAFVRQKGRLRWYWGKAAKLFGAALVYYALYFSTGIVVCLLYGAPVDQLLGVLRLAGTLTLLYALFAFAGAMAMNLLSLVFNSMTGYVAVGLTLLASIVTACVQRKQYTTAGFLLNPVVQLIPDWHTGVRANPTIDALEHFPLYASVLYLAAAALVVLVVGAIVVRRLDITLKTRD